MSTLGVLVWKHAVVRRRRIIHTIFEFFSPAILFILLYLLWRELHSSPPSKHDGQHGIEEPVHVHPGQRLLKLPEYIYYYPSSERATKLMEKASRRLDLSFQGPAKLDEYPVKGIWSFADETEFLTYVNRSEFETQKYAGVKFENDIEATVHSSLNYTIRLKEDFSTQTYIFDVSVGSHHEQHGVQYYGFVMIQWAIDASFLELGSNNTVTQELSVQHFPKPHVPHKNEQGEMLGVALLWVCGASPLAFLLSQVARLSRERCSGIQELMMMSGVHRNYITLGHIINAVPAWLVYVISGTVLGEFLPAGSYFPLALMLILYFFYVVIWAFMCSAILNKPNEAVTLALLIYTLTFPLTGLAWRVSDPFLLVLAGFLPHMPLAWLCRNMGGAVYYGADLRWGAGIRSPVVQNAGSITFSFIMMVVQIILLALLTEYVRLVRPGKYGVARPWNFFISYSERVEPDIEKEGESEPVNRNNGDYFESPPQDVPVGISVRNVTKVFRGSGPPKTALDNISLQIYQGEITVLLGHNGAGKTTLMSIITGMYSPTRGEVLINGKNVLGASKVRKDIGLCPQHNLTFEDLTVREHFLFFGRLKGLTGPKAIVAADRLLDQMNLADKSNDLSSALSGGMKRRLQLGCALVGDSPVLILDEPTSGLDVETRRELWNMLLSLRGDRTVLLTTHFMEEADALGDRVAALHVGRLRCHATPMFLKRAIGSGYRLSLSMERHYNRESVLEAVARCLSDAQLTETTATQVTFCLPADESEQFPKLFNHLEAKKDTLNIKSMSVGVTTLEEVFLKLCSDVGDGGLDDDDPPAGSVAGKPPQYRRLTGAALLCQQFVALLTRQIRYIASKDPGSILRELIFPVILTLAIVYFANGLSSTSDMNPPLTMTADLYTELGKTTVYYDMALPGVSVEPLAGRYGDLKFVKSSDVVGDILKEGQVSMSNYDQLLIALHLNTTDATALYTTRVRHAAPVAVNLVSNLLAQAYLGTDDPQLITVVNHPIPTTRSIERDRQPLEAKTLVHCFWWALCVANLCTFIMIPMATIAVLERTNFTRHLRIISGVPCAVYYAAMLVFHVAAYAVIAVPIMVIAATAFESDATFDNKDFIGATLVMVLVYGVTFTPFIYLLSHFANESGASAILSLVSVMFGFFTPFLRILTRDNDSGWLKLVQASAIFPSYDFTYGLLKMATAARYNRLCVLNKSDYIRLGTVQLQNSHFDAEECLSSEEPNGFLTYFNNSYNGVLPEVVIMLALTAVFWCLILLLEKKVLNRWRDVLLNKRYESPDQRYKDQHVQTEREYVQQRAKRGAQATLKDDAALVNDVHKQYRSVSGKPHLAVRGVSFSVKQGECFGLLGVNGAGKSTVFKMLTGCEHPTRGNIFANGYALHHDRYQYLSTLAYCPQFEGLDGFLTGWDNVKIAALLRGVPKDVIDQEVQFWIDCVDLSSESKRPTCGYSGGCVRRCLTAATLAGVGGSQCLALLDEPTSGVDPGARRKVWRTLRRSLASGLSIVISSHSMDETETLCGRIAIVSRGQVGALGSAAELRARHAAGFTAIVKLRQDQESVSRTCIGQGDDTDGSGLSTPLRPTMQSLKQQIQKVHEAIRANLNGVVKDEHKSMLHYHLPDGLSYSAVFSRMEAIRREFDAVIEDYTISGTTLEEVFLSFAKDASEDSNSEV